MNKKLKILIAHNAYQQRGGEDSVVEAEFELLRSRGHYVRGYFRHNDEISEMARWAVAGQTFWSSSTCTELSRLIEETRPDVIHVHNTFPLISPSIFWAAARQSVPVVQTLHNFRLSCLSALFMRDGRVCEDCMGRVPWRGVLNKCYRDSATQSTVLASMLVLHRTMGTWTNKISRYIALNEFCRQKFIEGGLPSHKVVVKPNFVDFPAPEVVERNGFLFVGRLSTEKGIGTLVKAAILVKGATVRVAGTGPEVELLSDVPNISYIGALQSDGVRHQMAGVSALILPSVWYENFPRTLVEAFGCGLPVIASRIGALAELVEDGVTGLLFEPGDPASLAAAMRWALDHPAEMAAMGKAARAHYEANFTAERNYHELLAIYEGAVAEVRGRAL